MKKKGDGNLLESYLIWVIIVAVAFGIILITLLIQHDKLGGFSEFMKNLIGFR